MDIEERTPMSKINPGLYSSDSHTWQTPPDFIQALLKFEGKLIFDLDPCCTTQNIPATQYYTEKEDGLSQPWHIWQWVESTRVFMNPPYGSQLPKWIKKAHDESLKGARVWGLIPARPDTRYWHEYVFGKNSFVVFLKGRLKFLKDGEPGAGDGPAPFPTALVYWGSDWKEVKERWLKENPIPGSLVVCE